MQMISPLARVFESHPALRILKNLSGGLKIAYAFKSVSIVVPNQFEYYAQQLPQPNFLQPQILKPKRS